MEKPKQPEDEAERAQIADGVFLVLCVAFYYFLHSLFLLAGIAQYLIKMLAKTFKERENRDPTNEEMQELLGQLTEERVQVL